MSRRPAKSASLLLGLGSVAATAVIYAPALRFPLFAESYVEFSPLNADQFPASRWLRGNGPYYRPAARWIYHVWYVAGGRQSIPPLDHAVQIALHLGCVGLLFFLLLRQTGSPWAASAGALTLGLHPSITPAVVYSSVAWCPIVTLVFLIGANVYDWSFEQERPPALVLFLVIPPLLLFLALVAETGALAAGMLTVWAMVTIVRRRDTRTTLIYTLPPAAVGVAYLAMRRLALGHLASPYVRFAPDPGGRLQTYAANVLYDTSLILNPIRVAALDVDPAGDETLLRAAAILLIVIGASSIRSVRRVLLARPLPAIGLLMFFVFQSMALWLVPKVPIARAGVDRGWVYHVAIALVGLLAGGVLSALARRGPPARAVLIGLACGACLLSATIATRSSLLLWRQAGALLERDREALLPLLGQVPEGTAFVMQGFPDVLRAPYLPWAVAYYYSKSRIISAWAGKDLLVYWDTRDSPPPDGFRGYVVERSGGTLRWRSEDSAVAARTYLDYPGERTTRTFPLADETRPGELAPGLFWHRADALVSGRDTLLVHVRDADANVSLRAGVDPRAYGVLRYELRIFCLDDGASVATTQVYFGRRGQGLDELKSMAREVAADGEWHEVRWPLFQNPRWIDNGSIDELRLDLLDRLGVLELRGLRLENDLDWPRRMDAARVRGTP